MWDIINILIFYLLGLLIFGPKSQIGQERPGHASHGARFSQARPYFPLQWHVFCHQTRNVSSTLFFTQNSLILRYHLSPHNQIVRLLGLFEQYQVIDRVSLYLIYAFVTQTIPPRNGSIYLVHTRRKGDTRGNWSNVFLFSPIGQCLESACTAG